MVLFIILPPGFQTATLQVSP